MAAALFGLTIAVIAAAVPLGLGREPAYDTVTYGVLSVVLGVTGLLVARRRPENRIGWFLLAFGLCNAGLEFWQGLALRRGDVPDEDWVVIWGALIFHLAWSLLFLWFPDGRLPSRRWRWWPPLAVAALALTIPGLILDDDTLFAAGLVLYVPAFAAPLAAVIARFRRARGDERLQMKWFAYAATLAVIVLTAAFALWYVTPVIRWLAALAELALPVAACVAILRYRLYDIDVVINRTLVYGALTMTLAATYAATALGLGAVLGRDSALAVAAATLLAAAVFRPLRWRLQDAVDRRFDRSRYAARQRIAAFLDDLREGRAQPEQVVPLLREVLDDPGLELRFLQPGDRPAAGAIVVERTGVPLAEVRSAAPRDRVAEAIDAAGLALEIARHLDDVRASRARIVAAGDAVRRRLERDLHDGAQARLVAIGLALRHAQHELGDEGRRLEDAVDQIVLAIAELRELAGGVRPSQLDAGLAAALRDLASRAPLPVTVEATAERFAEGSETAAYFVAAEGLTNAVKHARAGRVILSAGRQNGTLVVRVSDDGVGGATARGGSGLAGLSDRVIAEGGRLRLHSPPGAGTTVTAELPCGS